MIDKKQAIIRQLKALKELEHIVYAANERMKCFSIAIYKTAEAEYLKQKRVLPGSLRTIRLRKKRHKMVMKWYICYLQ